MTQKFKITSIYAYIAEYEEHGEGIIGQMMPDKSWMPFVGADEARVKSLRPMAERISNITNKEIKLIKLSIREDVEIIKPEPSIDEICKKAMDTLTTSH